METFGSTYSTPGWQRAKGRGGGASGSGGFGGGGTGRAGGFSDGGGASYRSGPGIVRNGNAGGSGAVVPARKTGPVTIEGELVTKSTGVTSAYKVGDRVFHQKFGNGNVRQVEGNKLTIAFDRAGQKKVVDSFVQKV
jgi:DNA helicase-2/ATP-dependent DNA helicase PcrA